jgi:putative ABC transport system permease protein
VLFSYLAAVRVAFSAGVDVAGADRLLTTHKTSIIQPLPARYKDEIARVPGVVAVTHASWFGGIYQNPNTGFQGVFQAPIEPESYLAMYPEMKVDENEKRAWLADREGVLVGSTTAKRYGWKVGDRVPVQATFWRKKDGGKVWEFNIRGIYTGGKGLTRPSSSSTTTTSTRPAVRQGDRRLVHRAHRDPRRPPRSARRSTRCSRTPRRDQDGDRKGAGAGFADQIGNIGAIIQWILAAVFFTLLLVTANTIAQSVRERTSELRS